MATQAEIAEGSSIVSSKQIDYQQKVFSHPSYVHRMIAPNTNGQTISLNSSQTPVTFTIPPEVFNLSQSYLSFQISLPAVAANYTWIYADVFASCISHIQHYCSNNGYIVDIDNLQNYMKIVDKKETALQEMQTTDSTYGLYPSNSLVNAVPALRNGYAQATTPITTVNPSSVNYLEPAYFTVGALNTALTINCMLPLRRIKNTAFAIDKDLYYGQLSYLKLYFGPLSKVCYMSTSNANPSLGTVASYTGAGTIVNLQLYMAMETNEALISMIKGKVLGPGLSYFIPYVIADKSSNPVSSTAVSNHYVTRNYDIGSGQSLLKIYHSLFNPFETLDSAYDCSNISNTAQGGSDILGNKVSTYYTQLNGKRQQELTLDCTGTTAIFSDYMVHKKMLRGSVLQNRNIYQQNWFHCDDFTEMGAVADQEGREELIAGIPMGPIPLNWSIVAQVAAQPASASLSLNHYTWAVFQRKLMITPQAVLVQ